METIKTIVVDDEPPARRLIGTMLAGESDFEIVAECANGGEAIDAIERHEPDLVFLDIQMPEIDGFDVLMAVDEGSLPAVVFVTAYDQYAVRAFEVHALDYLLKPFDDERFAQTLDRAREQVERRRSGDRGAALKGMLDQIGADRGGADRLLVKSAGCITFLKTDEIDWIEAAGNYLQIHAGGEVHLMRQTMSSMETQLDPRKFVRIHRSAMVNLDRIRELRPSVRGEFCVLLRGGRELTLSRKYRPVLEERLGRAL